MFLEMGKTLWYQMSVDQILKELLVKDLVLKDLMLRDLILGGKEMMDEEEKEEKS